MNYRTLFLLFSIITLLFSCGRKDLKLKHEADNLRNELKKSCLGSLADFDKVQPSRLKAVDTSFFRKYLSGLSLQHNKMSIEEQGNTSFRFLDYKENGAHLLFSVMKEDETGYRTVYFISVNTRTGERKGILLTKVGTDGVHTSNANIKWINDTVLSLLEVSTEKDGSAFLIDSTQQNIILRQGRFEFRNSGIQQK